MITPCNMLTACCRSAMIAAPNCSKKSWKKRRKWSRSLARIIDRTVWSLTRSTEHRRWASRLHLWGKPFVSLVMNSAARYISTCYSNITSRATQMYRRLPLISKIWASHVFGSPCFCGLIIIVALKVKKYVYNPVARHFNTSWFSCRASTSLSRMDTPLLRFRTKQFTLNLKFKHFLALITFVMWELSRRQPQPNGICYFFVFSSRQAFLLCEGRD